MIRKLIRAVIVGLVGTGCYYNESTPSDQNVWPVAQPANLEMNEARLLDMDSALAMQSNEGITSVVVIKEGQLVYERYYFGYDRSTLFELGGLSSVISNLAIGRAIDMGLITSVEDSIYKYLPEFSDEFEDFPLKKNITFEHLMTMKSGLSWNELTGGFDGQLNDIGRIAQSESWTEFVITKPLDALPGTRYTYNSAIPILIAATIENEYGDGIHSFLLNEALTPIDIKNIEIARFGNNTNSAWGISLSTLDLAKVGYFYLKRGDWFGEQVMSEAYLDASVDIQTNVDYSNDFGWMWWRYSDNSGFLSFLDENDTFFAAGNGNERLYVIPHLDLVVAITGKNERADFDLFAPFVFRDYILRSIQ